MNTAPVAQVTAASDEKTLCHCCRKASLASDLVEAGAPLFDCPHQSPGADCDHCQGICGGAVVANGGDSDASEMKLPLLATYYHGSLSVEDLCDHAFGRRRLASHERPRLPNRQATLFVMHVLILC
ncbi:MAG: hypothetical protein ACIALR_13530 [Blastopirellula sp. JB062]